MLAPEEQQMAICLLKSNLEEISNDLVEQRTALPSLDAENEQQYRETMSALRIARSVNAELESLKQENVRLIARRMQLKQQCTEASAALCEAREQRDELMHQLNAEDKDEELVIRKYEDSLREKADRFRKARVFYNEEEMKSEIAKVSADKTHLYDVMSRAESQTELLSQQLQALRAAVPEHIVDILGKNILNEKLKELTINCEEFDKKRNDLHSKGKGNSV